MADHEDAPGGMVLDDGGDEAVGFFEIEIHCDNTYGNNKKNPPISRRASFPIRMEWKLGQGPSRDGMDMVMMPRDIGQCHNPKV
jgi:hypothetical protein